MNTCSTCKHWCPPLKSGERFSFDARTERLGACQAAGSTPDMEVDGPDGCSECDPYSSKQLLTSARFGCTLHKS